MIYIYKMKIISKIIKKILKKLSRIVFHLIPHNIHLFFTMRTKDVYAHYKENMIKSLFIIFGSINLIGNPV